MSVINTMLRDLDARGGDTRKPKIPVRSEKPASRPWLLIATAVVAAAAIGWQLLAPQPAARGGNDTDGIATAASAPAHSTVNVATITDAAASVVASAPVAPNQSAKAPAVSSEPASPQNTDHAAGMVAAAAPVTLQASWQWSNDGFALQLGEAGDVRYGIERVDAGTLKISLSHASLALLDIPAPTPGWVDNVRLQRDVQQQTVTISAQSRLEYEIARLDDGALIISVWRDANPTAASTGKPIAATGTSREAVEENAPVAQPASDARVTSEQPREYTKPRIDRSVLTPAQRDVRNAAQATTQLRAGQTSDAISALRTALRSDDAAPKSAALLVTILMSQQRLQDAQPYLDRALQQTPQDGTLLKLKARMLVAQGDIARARAMLAPLAPAASSDVELVALAASLAQQVNDSAAASELYLQWTRIEPGSGAAWYGLALAFDAQASSINAIAAYQHALTLVSDTRLRDYANARLAELQRKNTEPVATSAAVAR